MNRKTFILQQGVLKENDLEQDNSMKNHSLTPQAKNKTEQYLHIFLNN